MKKSKPVFAILLCGLALGMIPLINNINHGIVEKTRALTVTGELNGGAKTTYQASALNTSEQYFVATLVQNSNSGNNFYVRIKNYSSSTVDVHVIMESVNGHASQVKSNGKYVLYAPNGTQLEEKISTSGRYVTLPAKFNGIFSLASLQLADVPEWDQGETSKDVKNIKAIHFGVIAQSENITLEIGDVFTNDLLNLDASSLNNEEFALKYAVRSDSARIVSERLPIDDFVANHDLNGAAFATVKQLSTDIHAYFKFYPANPNLSNDDCLFFRIKNAWPGDFYIEFYILSTNGHRMALGLSKSTYKYDANGKNKSFDSTRAFGSYIHIAGNYDGYIGIPYDALIDDPDWADNTSHPDMDYSSIYALYFGLSTQYDYEFQPIFGDIFTNNAVIFDGSEYSRSQFNDRVTVDELGSGQYINLSQMPGYKDETTVDYSHTTNYSQAEVNGGVEALFSQSEPDRLSSFIIHLNSVVPASATALAIRVKNYTYDYPTKIYISDASERTVTTQGQVLGNVYYIKDDGTFVVNEWDLGMALTPKIPTSFDGLMIIPFASLCGGEYLDKEHLTTWEFCVNTKYDFNFHSSFGDYGYIGNDLAYHQLVDVSSLNETQWNAMYVTGRNPENVVINRAKEAPKCSWIGDTKILNTLVYEKDEDMTEELLTDEADNPLVYTRKENGLQIDICQYETGHKNGPYSALVLVNNSKNSDRLKMVRETDSAVAKGLTLYVKNLTSREIGIALSFEQTVDNSTTPQRWTLLGYPSMYYAYDVVKDVDYVFYFKRDQFQIPVGFEGYVRLPFSSYGIPDWCKTNAPLDLNRFTGALFLSQDNRSYGGLSYLVKNVGVYFNDTTAGSMFSDENTIKKNMGL